MNPGIVPDMPENIYHSHNALSSTGARLLLESPAKFHYRQTHPQQSTAAFDLGSAVHAKVLGVGWAIEELDFPDWRTKAAQAARDEARDNGLIPMLTRELVTVHRMSEAVLAHKTAREMLELPGERELSAFATIDGVDVRARLDALTDSGIGIDLKTTAKPADPLTFARSVVDYGYDVQAAWYTDALAALGTELDRFQFIVVEKEAPHLVSVLELDIIFREMGKVKAAEARRRYAECTATNTWPGHPDDIQLVAPPTWAEYAHEDLYGPLSNAEIRI